MSHRGEGKAVLVISQFSHNLSVSLSNYYSAKNLKLTQVEHACSDKATSFIVFESCLFESMHLGSGEDRKMAPRLVFAILDVAPGFGFCPVV